MPYDGTIISHDASLHVGLIMPKGAAHAVQFTEGDLLNWDGRVHLLGMRVSFEVVNAPRGPTAVYVRLAMPQKQLRGRLGGEWSATIITPLLVPLLTYLLSHHLLLPKMFTYLISVNIVTLVLYALTASRGYTHSMRPSEALLLFLAACGGSPACLFGLFFFRTRFNTKGFYILIAFIMAVQFMAIKRYAPGLLTSRVWRVLHVDQPGAPRTLQEQAERL